MLHNYRIGTRLGVGFGAVLLAALAAFVAIVAIALDSQRQTLAAVNDVDNRVGAAHTMIVAQLEAAVSVRNAARMNSANAVQEELKTYNKALVTLREQESAFQQRELDETSKELLGTALWSRKLSEPIVADVIDHVSNLRGEEGARVLRQQLDPVQVEWVSQLKQLADNERKVGEARVAAARHAELLKISVLAAVLLAVMVASVGFSVLLARSITRPLKAATQMAGRVAQGDLTSDIMVLGKDEAAEMLHALGSMSSRLSDMVESVRESTDSIATASQQISSGNLDLSTRTEVQAASLQRTSTSLHDLINVVTQNKDNADSARLLAERAAESAEVGGEAMAQVTTTMAGITESSRHIAEIIGVIDGIAFQTNLLALNAAVEAAGAGDRGRGFAVVANEVRALAQRAAASASEVRALIQVSAQRVDAGAQQVSNLSSTMKGLVANSRQVKALVNDIARSCATQRESISEVGEAVRDVDGLTSQNASLVEEVSAAAQSLVEQTQTLRRLVGQFRTRHEEGASSAELQAPAEQAATGLQTHMSYHGP